MTNTNLSKAAAALGHKGGSSTSEAKQAASRANGSKGGRPHNIQPKYSAGDMVIVTDQRDSDYGCVLEVLGMSPSTKINRSRGQWRYHLSNRAYYDEKYLERA